MKKSFFAALFAVAALATAPLPAAAQSRNLAPGFEALPKGAKIAIMPSDIELFSISAGGVSEPKADWTEAASKHFKAALAKKNAKLGLQTVEVSQSAAEDLAELNAVHGAVARAIAIHHFGNNNELPSKGGKLDWSLGEPAELVRKATGADYALFSWIRDGYASGERQAAIAAMAILSLGRAIPGGGRQVGYASLVDLRTGRIVWFNRLLRNSGDLREAEVADETLDTLLTGFPVAK